MAELDEVDMDGVGEAWGDELDLGEGGPAGDDEGGEIDGFGDAGAGEEGDDEEGGWEMEVQTRLSLLSAACSVLPGLSHPRPGHIAPPTRRQQIALSH